MKRKGDLERFYSESTENRKELFWMNTLEDFFRWRV